MGEQNGKPAPDGKAKEKAAEMMQAYVDRPTLVLPGTGGTVSGTAVGDWLDEDGNPKALGDEDAPAAKAKSALGDDCTADDKQAIEEQIEKDKAFNEGALQAAKAGGADDEEAKAKAAH